MKTEASALSDGSDDGMKNQRRSGPAEKQVWRGNTSAAFADQLSEPFHHKRV